MIFGIGCDLVEIARIGKALERHKESFIASVLSEEEKDVYEKRAALSAERGVRYVAGRWAAKEALSKALGTGVRGDVVLRHISVLNDEQGAPFIKLSGALEQTVRERQLSFFVSISDTETMSMATVVCERISHG